MVILAIIAILQKYSVVSWVCAVFDLPLDMLTYDRNDKHRLYFCIAFKLWYKDNQNIAFILNLKYV